MYFAAKVWLTAWVLMALFIWGALLVDRNEGAWILLVIVLTIISVFVVVTEGEN